jgi:hypothetical protein
MAHIRASDIHAAEIYWRRLLPEELRNLLSASRSDETATVSCRPTRAKEPRS